MLTQLSSLPLPPRHLDRPHLVICVHEATGVTSYQGPYPDGLSALVAAEAERSALAHDPTEGPVRLVVAPLFAPGPTGPD